MSTIPTMASEIRNKLRDIPKTKMSEKKIIKENLTKNVTDTSKKRNIIYNYNYIKKDKDSGNKRALLTLPS